SGEVVALRAQPIFGKQLAVFMTGREWSDTYFAVPSKRTASLTPEKTNKPRAVLPLSLQPRRLSRGQSAAYVAASPSLFDIMVQDGRMPGPKRINSRVVWDRIKLDVAFDALPEDDASLLNPWDEVAA